MRTPDTARHGLARVLSKRGLCSRTQAAAWIAEGRVSVNGRVVRNAEFPVRMDVDRVDVRGIDDVASARTYVALNKPRGLVTTAHDEKGRDTVYRCFDAASLPWIAPVGRLDKASEGLLLFSNDPVWAARVTDPSTGPSKVYHVQIDRLADDDVLAALRAGVADKGEHMSASSVSVLRQGTRNAWLEIVLDEGRNRQIRRMLAAQGVGVMRLVRVSIGEVMLGELPKGGWRLLSADEVESLATRVAAT